MGKSNLSDIRKAISKHFGGVASVKKLQSANRSKTVSLAKSIGVYIAHENGHKNNDIAKAFGYQNESSVSRVYSTVSKEINSDLELKNHITKVNEELSL